MSLTSPSDCFMHRRSAFAGIGALALMSGILLISRSSGTSAATNIPGIVMMVIGLLTLALSIVHEESSSSSRRRTTFMQYALLFLSVCAISGCMIGANVGYVQKGKPVPQWLYWLALGLGALPVFLVVWLQSARGHIYRIVGLAISMLVVAVGGIMWVSAQRSSAQVQSAWGENAVTPATRGGLLLAMGLAGLAISTGLCK